MAHDIPEHTSLIPGDPDGIASMAREFAESARAIRQAAQDLRELQTLAGESESDAIVAVELNSRDVRNSLEVLDSRYDVAATQLRGFAAHLKQSQEHARALVARRQELQGEIQAQETRLDRLPEPTGSTPLELMEDVQRRREYERRIQGRINDSIEGIERIDQEYRQTRDELIRGGVSAAAAMKQAMEQDQLNDAFFDGALDILSDMWSSLTEVLARIFEVIKAVLEEIAKYLMSPEFWELLHEILGWISFVASILAFIPALTPFLAPIIAGITLVNLAIGAGILIAKKDGESWQRFGWDVFATVTLGVGTVAGKIGSSASSVYRAATIQSRVAQSVAQGSSQVVGSSVQAGVRGAARLASQTSSAARANAQLMAYSSRIAASARKVELGAELIGLGVDVIDKGPKIIEGGAQFVSAVYAQAEELLDNPYTLSQANSNIFFRQGCYRATIHGGVRTP